MKSMPMLHPCALACCALLAACMAPPARAQSASPAQAMLESPLAVSLGAFVLNTDLRGRLNGEATSNPDVDFDSTFGRDNNASRVRADVLWRITPTHHLRLMYFDNQRDASRVLDHDVQWGDYTFQAGSRIDSRTRFEITELAYEYAFMKWANFELAGSLGVHNTKLQIGLSGAATVTDANGKVSAVTPSTKTSDVSAPLPVIGVRAAWAVSPQWVLEAQGQYFRVSVNGYDGILSDLRAGATWMVNRHFGIGVGYDRFVTSIKVDRDNFNGRLRVAYAGLLLYATGTF